MVYKGLQPEINADSPVTIGNTANVRKDHKTQVLLANEDIVSRRMQLEHEIREFDERKLGFDQYIQLAKEERLTIIDRAVLDANMKRDMLIKTAITEAEGIRRQALHDATREAEALKKAAYQAGYQQGRDDSVEEHSRYIDQAIIFLGLLQQEKETLFNKYENELIQSTLAMTEKIVTRMIAQDNSIVLDIVKQAAKNFRDSDQIHITVSALDFDQIVSSDFAFLNTIIPKLTHITAELAEDLPSGAAVLDDGTQIVDAGVITQLDFLAEIARNSGIQ